MKVLALALDYDGTIAANDAVHEPTKKAIADLRAKGVTVVLATGRRLDDLLSVADGLHFVDAVVAENGAILFVPQSGYMRVLGPARSELLMAAMTRKHIPFTAGTCVIDAHAKDAGLILQVIRDLELPVVQIFNRSRVMLLPQGISKATGLMECLAMLRISPHNTLAIGDAENDHAMLNLAEIGAAVAWGSDHLKNCADVVVPGQGPQDIAAYLHRLSISDQMPIPAKARRQLTLGHRDDGRALSLAIRGRNVLVSGDPKSGKSWVVGLLCEQLILQGYSLCILDPEGDYTSLESLPGVRVFGGSDPLPKPLDLVKALRHADVSVVLDLSQKSHDDKLSFVSNVLPALATLRQSTGVPHRIILDEAHYFLREPEEFVLRDLRGGGYTLATYRASELSQEVLAAASAIVVTSESDPHEVDNLGALCALAGNPQSCENWFGTLTNLKVGEAMVLPLTRESQGTLAKIRLAPRLTSHARHCAKYLDVPVSERYGFVFRTPSSRPDVNARTMRDFVAAVENRSDSDLLPYCVRGDFSKWIREVFGDYPLSKSVADIEKNCGRPRSQTLGRQIGVVIRMGYQFAEGDGLRMSDSTPGGSVDSVDGQRTDALTCTS